MQTLTGTPKPILTPIQVGQASVKCLKWGDFNFAGRHAWKGESVKWRTLINKVYYNDKTNKVNVNI